MGLNTFGRNRAIFTKEANFSDFLFASLNVKPLLERDQKHTITYGSFFVFMEYSIFFIRSYVVIFILG